MKIDNMFSDYVSVSVRTDTHGGSAWMIHQSYSTEVMWGYITKVRFKDFGIEIEMNTEIGEGGRSTELLYKDPEYARAKAFEALKAGLTMEGLAALIKAARQNGERDGERSAKNQIRTALGL